MADQPPLGTHHGGSFRTYMKHKRQKLDQQLNTEEGPQDHHQRLFHGKVFTVDGAVDPSLEELRRLVVQHGGFFDAYLTSRVTHVLCNHLPRTKLEKINKRKRMSSTGKEPVYVLPAYVTDSARLGKLVPHAPYLIDGLRSKQGMGPLHVDDRGASALKRPPHTVAPTLSGGGVSPPAAAVDFGSASSSASHHAVSMHHHKMTAEPHQQGTPLASAPLAVHSGPQTRAPAPLPPSSATDADPSSFLLSGTTTSTTPTPTSAAVNPTHQGTSLAGKRPRSTKEDADFITSFYASSRLHFIGSFRSHLQNLVAKRTTTSEDDVPCPGPGAADEQDEGVEAAAARVPEEGEDDDREEGVGGDERVVLHVDMDCFFVSVLVRDRPELEGRPVAVAHHDGSGGQGSSSSEISSCNYAARAKGVKAGMWMGHAKQLCPDLVVLPYDFQAYQTVSDHIYRLFLEESGVKVQPVSCDEAYLELPPGTDGGEAARRLRERIMRETRCPASAGIGPNMLIARLATKRAKPNGQLWVRAKDAMDFVRPLRLSELPGVGDMLTQRLSKQGLVVCGDAEAVPLLRLKDLFGTKTGAMLWAACRGRDDRPLQTTVVRKSLGADVNWGVRFSEAEQARQFLSKLAVEVSRRLEEAEVRGRCVTLRLKESAYGPGEPEKLLGCGRCHNHSRTVTLPKGQATADSQKLAAAVVRMYDDLRVPACLVRGLGIQVSKLEPVSSSSFPPSSGASTLLNSWLLSREETGEPTKFATSLSPVRAGRSSDYDDTTSITTTIEGSSSSATVAALCLPLLHVVSSRDPSEGRGSSLLFETEAVDRVLGALVPWLHDVGPRPGDAHTQLVALYLIEMARMGRADDTSMLLRALRRHVAQGVGGDWTPALASIERAVDTQLSDCERSFQGHHYNHHPRRQWCEVALRVHNRGHVETGVSR